MQNLLINNKILVQDNKLKSQLIQKGFGEKTSTEFVLDLVEALYLMQKQKLEITDSDEKKVTEKQLLALGEKKLKEFYNVFLVYSDLRERGYVPKTGFKFGFHLRVYPKGKKQGEAHSQWVINVATQNEKLGMIQLSRIVRLSANIKTTLLQAVVDSENDINYYSFERITP